MGVQVIQGGCAVGYGAFTGEDQAVICVGFDVQIKSDLEPSAADQAVRTADLGWKGP